MSVELQHKHSVVIVIILVFFMKFCSLRHQFQVEDSPINPLHGSDSPETAEKEIQQFFPVQSTVAVIKPDIEPDKRGLCCFISMFLIQCFCIVCTRLALIFAYLFKVI